MANETSLPGFDDHIYDNLFGIKLKGLFNKENREARKERRAERKANRQANKPNRSEGGTRFKNILSGLGSAASAGAGIYSNLKSQQSAPGESPAPEPKKNNTGLFIGIGVAVVVIIVVVIVIIKNKK